MFNIKNFSLFCLFFAVLIAPLLADFQTFKSDSGATIEAELIELGKSGKTVDIRLKNGNKISADLSSFSSEDQSKIKEWWRDTQAEKQVLSHESRIDINAKMNRKSRDNKYNGYYHTDDQTKSYFPEVVIKNRELDTFTGNTVRVVVIAKDLHTPDQRLIVSAKTLEANFDDRSETILESDPFKLRLYEYDSSYFNYDYAYGYEYEGYAVVIKNSKGEITHFRATKAKYISNMKLIYECEAGQIYDESVSRKLNVSPNSYFVR